MNAHADQRALTLAIGASLALHAVLLALRPPESQPPVSAPSAPLVAQLVEPQPPAAPAPVTPPAPEPKRELAKPPPPKTARPTPVPQPRPTPLPVPAAEAPAPAPAPSPAPAATPAAPAQQAAPIQGQVASAPPAPPVASPDPTMLIAQYRQQFINAAVRYKRYPLLARDNGWEGDVVVHLEIAPNGELAELKVKRGSGHTVLDEQALEMFRMAAPQVPVPPALRGRAFGFDVRALYSLKD